MIGLNDLKLRNFFDSYLHIISNLIGLENYTFSRSFYVKRLSYLDQKYSGTTVDTKYLFIGDSYIQKLPVEHMFNVDSVNLGISAQTTVGLISVLRNKELRVTPSKVVMLIGFNDLKYRDEDLIIAEMSKLVSLLLIKFGITKNDITILSLLPIDSSREFLNKKIVSLNQKLQVFSNHQGVGFIDIYSCFLNGKQLDVSGYYEDDLVHLSVSGYRRLSVLLQERIEVGYDN